MYSLPFSFSKTANLRLLYHQQSQAVVLCSAIFIAKRRFITFTLSDVDVKLKLRLEPVQKAAFLQSSASLQQLKLSREEDSTHFFL